MLTVPGVLKIALELHSVSRPCFSNFLSPYLQLQVNELQQKLKEYEIQANLRRHADTAASRMKKSPAAHGGGDKQRDDSDGQFFLCKHFSLTTFIR